MKLEENDYWKIVGENYNNLLFYAVKHSVNPDYARDNLHTTLLSIASKLNVIDFDNPLSYLYKTVKYISIKVDKLLPYIEEEELGNIDIDSMVNKVQNILNSDEYFLILTYSELKSLRKTAELFGVSKDSIAIRLRGIREKCKQLSRYLEE